MQALRDRGRAGRAASLPPATRAAADAAAGASTDLAQRLKHRSRPVRPNRRAVARAGRPLPPPPPRRRRRLDLRPRRAGLELPPAGRPLGRCARAGAAPASRRSVSFCSSAASRSRSRRRLSGGARADAPAGAAAGRRRDARRRQSRGARQGRGQGRGGAARRELQPRRRPHRGAGRRAPHAARQRLARAAHAAVAHPHRRRAARADARTRNTRRRSSRTSPSSMP